MSESEEKHVNHRINLLSEGLLIGLLTVASYFGAYQFEVGYGVYWGIPITLIEISLSKVLYAGISIYSVAYFMLFFTNPAISVFGYELVREDSLRRRTVIIHIGFLALGIFLFQVFGRNPIIFLFLIAFVVGTDIILMVLPYLWVRYVTKTGRGFFDRVQQFWAGGPPDAYDLAQKHTGINLSTALFVFAAFYLLSLGAGYGAGRSEKVFYIDKEANMALLRRYGDTYIYRQVTPDHDAICGDLVVRSRDDFSKIELHRALVAQTGPKDREAECSVPSPTQRAPIRPWM